MRYALIREMDVSNGEGVGVALFVQGCHFHCKGCFNKETWDFSGGYEWTQEAEDDFIRLVKRPYIKRVSILGGEPLAEENISGVADLLMRLDYECPDKKVWLYTGYAWENILSTGSKILDMSPIVNKIRGAIVALCDVIVDGPFQLDKQDLFNKEIVFAGSTNQRVIDVRRSLAEERVIAYDSRNH